MDLNEINGSGLTPATDACSVFCPGKGSVVGYYQSEVGIGPGGPEAANVVIRTMGGTT